MRHSDNWDRSNSVSRALHDIGLAAWFGGSLMGAVGVNAASKAVDDPARGFKVANAAWARWTPINLAAIAAHVAGSAMLIKANKSRMAGQKGVMAASAAKTAMTMVALAATAYSRALGERLIRESETPVEGAVDPSTGTPEDVAHAQKQLKTLQWAVPATTAAIMAVSSRMSEQQRPNQVFSGMLDRVTGNGKSSGMLRRLAIARH